MSLGWLTESALIPKASKSIKVESNSFLDLKIKLLEEKEKLTGGNTIPKNKLKKSTKGEGLAGKNKGIEERINKDKEEEKLRTSTSNLHEKQDIYNKLISDKESHKKSKEFLVDFEQKQWKTKESYGELLSKYKAKQQNLIAITNASTNNERVQPISSIPTANRNSRGGGLTGGIQRMEDERLEWERGVREGRFTEGEQVKIHHIPIIKQSWDNGLTPGEKQYLPEIIERREKQQKLLMLVKRKKEECKDIRQNKIMEMKNKRRKLEQGVEEK